MCNIKWLSCIVRFCSAWQWRSFASFKTLLIIACQVKSLALAHTQSTCVRGYMLHLRANITLRRKRNGIYKAVNVRQQLCHHLLVFLKKLCQFHCPLHVLRERAICNQIMRIIILWTNQSFYRLMVVWYVGEKYNWNNSI